MGLTSKEDIMLDRSSMKYGKQEEVGDHFSLGNLDKIDS
jgi:hypothetical protein